MIAGCMLRDFVDIPDVHGCSWMFMDVRGCSWMFVFVVLFCISISKKSHVLLPGILTLLSMALSISTFVFRSLAAWQESPKCCASEALESRAT